MIVNRSGPVSPAAGLVESEADRATVPVWGGLATNDRLVAPLEKAVSSGFGAGLRVFGLCILLGEDPMYPQSSTLGWKQPASDENASG